MAFVIDGHNLIGVLPNIDLADPDDEGQLLAWLRAYRARAGVEIIVFFDSGDLPARHPPQAVSGLSVHYASPGQTADEAIVAFLHGRTHPGQYAVVTNDHELSDSARLAGASVVSASQFAGHLVRRPHRPHSPAPEPGPNPKDPAYADIYAAFLRAERSPAQASGAWGEDFTAWEERLYGESIEEAQRAAEWLGQSGLAQALDPLRDALTHSDAGVRAAAALALGDLGERAAVADLCLRLEADPSSLVRTAAAQSLGMLGDRAAEPLLKALAEQDPKRKVRKAAAFALQQIQARQAHH